MSTAIQVATANDTFVHEGLFYHDDDDYLAGTVPFVAGALAAGEPVLVAVPGPNLERIRTALGPYAAGVRFADMTRAGRNPGRIIPWVLNAFITEHPGRHPYIIGEPIWAGRSADEYPACAQHEALINAAFTGRPATILCPYDASRLTARVLADAHATHPILVERGARRPSPEYAPLDIVAGYNRPLPVPDGPVVTREFEDAQALAALRELVAAEGRLVGLAGDRIADLQIAITELATNSLTHAGTGGVVRVWRTGDELVCEVQDRGKLTNPMAGRLPPPPTSPGGRGLLIVNHLCDLVRIHADDDSCTVRMHFRR
ncbi:MAG: anti-sigma regulatory factor [Actinobacteria bacterium 13_2_20CM_2_71_6]|nr:MAG: anti-sigma regulatory factor [Actinobacteria bacterium 13_2_20CM_2_71_6]